ncbi:MAG: chromate transporter [Firmicutes bacterium]|nr:chromate transporter [Bacillota bacterium]
MKRLLQIFLAFFRVGALTFGGGYTMLPMLQRETVDKTGWIEEDQLSDYYALAQCQPGLIAVNIAVLICRPLFGVSGAAAAVLGIATPSLLVILIIAVCLGNAAHLPWLGHAFAGVRVAVAVLVIQAALRLLKNGVQDKATAVIAAVSFIVLLLDAVNPVLIILAAALAGIGARRLTKRREGSGK